MKKITLLLLFTIFSIGVKSQSYKYHRFYSIVNGTQITKQFAEANCGQTYNFQQLRDRNYVNIQITTPLSSGKFYLLNFGAGLKYYYLYTSSSNMHNDEDYRINAHHKIDLVICPDSDNDGVPNSTDNCPNEAGQLSNNGCPVAHPSFYLERATVKQNGKTWNFLNNEVPTIETSLSRSDYDETEFNFTIFNNGGTKSRGTWSFFISNKDKLGSGQISIYKFFHRHTLSIPAKEETSRNIKKDIYARLQDGHIWDLYDNKTYYFHVFFEGTSMNPPLWEGSYHYVFPFKVKRLDYSSRALNISPSKILATYKIEIYNFSGQKVLSKEVQNTEQENNATLLLPKGLYIIKSEKGDRKIYVN